MVFDVNKDKKFFMIVLSMIVLFALTATLFVAALSSNDSDSSSDTSSTSQSTVDNSGLTDEEVAKVLEEIKASGINSDNASEKLDEIINKAILTNNATLKEYAEYAKQQIEIRKQLESVNAKITALRAVSSSIAEIDDQLQKSLESDASYADIRDSLSSSAMDVFDSLDAKAWTSMQDALEKSKSILGDDPSQATDTDRQVAELVLLNAASENGVLDDTQQEVADNAVNVVLNQLRVTEKVKYDSNEYNSLKQSSQAFSSAGKKAAAMLPDQVVMLGDSFKLNHAPILYNNEILLALDDVLQYIDATVQNTSHNSTISIQSKNKMVEIAAGKNIAYVNDKAVNLAVPVLNVNGVIYVTAQFFADTYGVEYEYIKDTNTIVMYGNLNQLKDPTTANKSTTSSTK